MAEYLIQDSTLTSIGNEIRTLRSSSSKMTPATMTSNLKSANTEVNNQTTIMNQILAALETKGDSGLNFTIVGGDTAPSNPTENTIWVNTTTPISSWEFSATQPIASSGKLWIYVGMSSTVDFNILNENSVKIYPVYAKQYISGAWTLVTAKSYQGGKWVEWWDGTLYNAGNEYTHITGGWEPNVVYPNDNPDRLIKNATSISMGMTSLAGSSVTTVNKIDLTPWKTLEYETSGNNVFGIHKIRGSSVSITHEQNCDLGGWSSNRGKKLDISAIEGEYYISIGAWNGSGSILFTSMKLS